MALEILTNCTLTSDIPNLAAGLGVPGLEPLGPPRAPSPPGHRMEAPSRPLARVGPGPCEDSRWGSPNPCPWGRKERRSGLLAGENSGPLEGSICVLTSAVAHRCKQAARQLCSVPTPADSDGKGPGGAPAPAGTLPSAPSHSLVSRGSVDGRVV